MGTLAKVDEAVQLLVSKGFDVDVAFDMVAFHGYVEIFEKFRGDKPMAIRPNGFINGVVSAEHKKHKGTKR